MRTIPISLTIAAVLAGPALAQSRTATAVDALIAQADAHAVKGEFKESLAVAQRAVALADAASPAEPELAFRAMRRLVVTSTYTDSSTTPEQFARLAPYAERAYGKDSFTAAFVRFKGVQWGYNSRRPGVGLPQLAAATDLAAVRAKTDEEVTLAAQALAILANHTSFIDIAAAQPIAERALALAQTVPKVTAAELGQTYGYLTSVALRADQPVKAMAMSERAVTIYETDQGAMTHHLVSALGTQATIARALGDLPRAEALLRRSVGILDARPALTGSYRARAFMDYGRFLASRGQHDLAFAMVERAVVENAAEPSAVAASQAVVVTAGQVYLEAGRHGDALRHLRRALEMTEQAGNANITQGQILVEIGRAQFASGESATAQTTADRALAVIDKTAPPGHSARGDVRLLLADLAEARGDIAGAATLYAAAASELKATGPDAALLATAKIRGAAMLARIDRLDEAGWRAARDGGDALSRGVNRTAATATGDRFKLGFAPTLLDGALDAAWARAHLSARR